MGRVLAFPSNGWCGAPLPRAGRFQATRETLDGEKKRKRKKEKREKKRRNKKINHRGKRREEIKK